MIFETCRNCGKPIKKGQYVAWTHERRNKAPWVFCDPSKSESRAEPFNKNEIVTKILNDL